jgi:hypothetical protein
MVALASSGLWPQADYGLKRIMASSGLWPQADYGLKLIIAASWLPQADYGRFWLP